MVLEEPFILYLRSFVADVQTAKSVDILLSHGKSEEEETVDVFSEIAPVVAIGNPQDRNLPLGAARLYFSDDVWKQKVLEMLSNAKLVVLRLGETSNFWWEVHNVLTYCPLEKVIFLIPAMKTSETIMRLHEICQEAGIELPEITAEKTSKGSVSSVLYYENGKMICQTLKMSKFTAFFISYREMLKKALQPVWATFGFSSQKYHFVRLARIIAILVLFSSLLFSVSSIIAYFQKRQELRFQAWELVNDLREYHPAITESWPEFPSDKHGTKLFKHIQNGLILLPDDEFYDCFKMLCGFIAQKQISESLCDCINHDKLPSADLFLQFMYAAKHTCTEERYQVLVQYLAQAADLSFQKMTTNEGTDTLYLGDSKALKEEMKIISDHLEQSEDSLDRPLPLMEITDLVLSAEGAKILLEALDEIEAKGLYAQKISRPIYLKTLAKLSPSFIKR